MRGETREGNERLGKEERGVHRPTNHCPVTGCLRVAQALWRPAYSLPATVAQAVNVPSSLVFILAVAAPACFFSLLSRRQQYYALGVLCSALF